MPSEDHKTQKKIQCWIPLETWDKIVSRGYTSPTIAVTKAFEKLLEDSREDPLTNPNKSREIPDISPETYKENINALNTEIDRLQAVIMECPDPLELAELKGNYTGLQRLLEEKDKRIEDLTREVSRLDMFAHYFKNVEVKQIEARVTEKVKPWWKFW